MRRTLLGKVRNIWVQLLICSSNLVRISCQEVLQIASSKRGNPRYLEGRDSLWNPMILIILCSIEIRVLKKTILDFSWLICIPDASMKVSRILFMDHASLTMGQPINKVSFTN
jgi:hypothetical protein